MYHTKLSRELWVRASKIMLKLDVKKKIEINYKIKIERKCLNSIRLSETVQIYTQSDERNAIEITIENDS